MKRSVTLTTFIAFFFLFTGDVDAVEDTQWSKNALSETQINTVVASGSALYVGSYPVPPTQGGIHRTTDGKTWELIGFKGVNITALLIDQGVIYAATDQNYTTTPIGIYRSTNNGQTWQHVGPFKGFLSLAKQGGTLFAGSTSGNAGVFRSTDGLNWDQVGLLGMQVHFLAANDTAVFSLVRSSLASLEGLYRSTDSGTTWTKMVQGSDASGLYADNKIVLATLRATLLRSTNGGASFQGVPNIPNIGDSPLGPITSDGKNYYLGNARGLNGILTAGILRSTDEGLTWTAMNNGLNFTTTSSSSTTTITYSPEQKKLYLSAYRQGLWEYQVESKLPPVIIIPGFGGTELVHSETGEIVWVNPSKQVSSMSDDFLDVLGLKLDGLSLVDSKLVTGKIFENLDFPGNIADSHFYDILKNKLITLGYIEGQNLFLYSYDWRRDINSDGWPNKSNITLKQLDELVMKLPEKPIIISHSLGGLVTANYINDSIRAEKVKTVITLGSPWQGAANAFLLLHYGQSFIPFLSQLKAMQLAQNFTSAYEILPTKRYFDNDSYYFIDQTDRDGDGITGPLNFDQTQSLIRRMHNPNAQDLATAFYSQGIGDWERVGTHGVKTYHVVGTGLGTPGIVREWYERNFFGVKKQKQSYTCIDGDGTIPFHSANVANPTTNQAVYYAKNIEHGQLPNDSNVHTLIQSILLDQPILENNVINKTPQGTFSGYCVKVFSPVSLHIYDASGNHDGLTESGDVEVAIPNSRYDILEESKIAVLPKADNYRIELKAEDTGTFDLVVDSLTDGILDKSSFFNDVPISSTSSQFRLVVTTNDAPKLSLDEDGNNSYEETLQPTSNLTTTQSADIQPPKTEIALEGKLGKNEWYTSTVSATLKASDNASGVLETRYQIGGGEVRRYKDLLSIDREGTNTLQVQSIDRVGNTEDPKTQAISIDSQMPTVSLDSPLLKQYLQGEKITLTFTATDDTSGIATMSARFNDQIILSGQTMTLNTLGKQTLRVDAEDKAGNRAALAHDFDVLFAVKVQFKPPSLLLSSKGSFVTVLLTMPKDYSADEVDISSVMIDGNIPTITKPKTILKVNRNKKDLRVDFDSKTFIVYVKSKNVREGEKFSFDIYGRLVNGIGFTGKAEVTVKK